MSYKWNHTQAKIYYLKMRYLQAKKFTYTSTSSYIEGIFVF